MTTDLISEKQAAHSPTSTNDGFQRIAIVGAGSMGLYFGGRLALGGADVQFLMRSDLDAVRQRGGAIKLHEKNGTKKIEKISAFAHPSEIGPVDLVIVTLKTTANNELSRLLPPLLGPHTTILTLQNGLGSDEELATLFGAERVIGGLASIASTRIAPGEVRCFHVGSVLLGEFGRAPIERTHKLAERMQKAGFSNARVVDNLTDARWRKLVWNVPFNGLTIAAGVTTDHLCADPLLANEVRALMVEVQSAAAQLGHNIPDEFLQQQFDITPPMGAYQPSSLVDFLAKREVEVESIWGEPLRRATAAGAQVPKLELLYALLKTLTVR